MIVKLVRNKQLFFALFLGCITSWLLKDNFFLFLLGGRSMALHGELAKGLLLAILIVFTSLFFLFLMVFWNIFSQKPGVIEQIKKTISGVSKMWMIFSQQINSVYVKVQLYLKGNAYLVFVLSIVALMAYGFELFNFNLTIDEEIHALFSGPAYPWVVQGRWGMYLLNKFLLSYTVMPFVPLFLALIFHICAILLLLDGWGVKSKLERAIVGSLSIAFPILAYMYTFSTINFGIGFGLFCVALSLFIYSTAVGAYRFYAIIPATFSIAIYQGFIPVLIAVFLVYLISNMIRSGEIKFKDLVVIFLIHVMALLSYFIVQNIVAVIMAVPHDPYTAGAFNISALVHDPGMVLSKIFYYSMLPIYLGNKSLYSVDVKSLGVLVFISSLSLVVGLWMARSTLLKKCLTSSLFLLLFVLPFASGLIMGGSLDMRMLISLPIVVPGMVMLGMLTVPRSIKILMAVLVGYCILQFSMSTNHLFASSHLALQEDRVLAARLIGRIEDAQMESGTESLKYMEVIGWYSRPSTELIPQIETFGASFFGWPQGTSIRAISFLETLGFPKLETLPADKRGEMVKIGNSMPIWPSKGSVKVIDDVVLIKFAPYSPGQINEICSKVQNKKIIQIQGFCK